MPKKKPFYKNLSRFLDFISNAIEWNTPRHAPFIFVLDVAQSAKWRSLLWAFPFQA